MTKEKEKDMWKTIMAWKKKHELGFWFMTLVIALIFIRLFFCDLLCHVI